MSSFIKDSNEIAARLIAEKKAQRAVAASKGAFAPVGADFMRIGDVLLVVPFSKTALYTRVKDGTFPAPKKIGARVVIWSRSEVQDWLAAQLKG